MNGKIIKKNCTCVLNSGDEVVFGLLGHHAYVSFSFVFLSASRLSGFPYLCFFYVLFAPPCFVSFLNVSPYRFSSNSRAK